MSLLRWPRTLVARLFLIFIAGLVLAQALSFGLLFYERYEATRSMMLGDLEHESSVAIDILNRLPPAERADWLPRLSNSNRQYLLGSAEADQPLTLAAAQAAAQSLEEALGSRWPLSIHAMRNDARHIQAEVTLADGEPVVLDIHLSMRPLALWLPLVLLAQLLLLIACAGLAVRLAVRPLTRLAHAADTLDPNRLDPRRQQAPLAESGPAEVAQAATAFNAMQTRIASHLAERMQMLGAISHDLQTPITRMKLRAEAMDESTDRDKLMQDLDEVERLVREGIDYARSAHGSAEKTVRLDLNAFLDSLVCDYQDTGKDVSLGGRFAEPVQTRAHALRRVLGNLIDNALKFAGSAEVLIETGPTPVIVVQDRGPGIPDDQLEAVLQPFYRLETSRNRGTGGTGLGLAIAQQLAQSLGGSLTLSARAGGGLVARVVLPLAAA